ncbi:glycosyltransferase [Pseudomonas sp. Leaf58]|uniref:glycosyltransferase n=1 Tax=Pseudomonas sp. Leaf58 TaxID=1736226 RepID=UPI0006FE0C0C|nr:glycosyltransferase [Pseudomonas sp. Leaf58]AYG46031.1 glycosyltransferase [Pseudomonas sp. Leaf58]KQN59684.1 glycosyl transferase family 2 [Pseudomonas sp. Leaf58]
MNAHPLVTIAIPAFNADFFPGTLSSALAQDYPNLEIVVCDDSAGSEIEAACQSLGQTSSVPLRYVRNPKRLGFACNLVACLEHSQGELIKFLCDDDTLFPSCISEQARALGSSQQISMVICQRLLCAADDVLLPSRALNFVISLCSAVLNGNDLLESITDGAVNLFGGISHALLRREQVADCLPTLVQEGRGFAARVDLALYACLLRRGHLCSLEQVLSLERVHPGRLSHQSAMVEAFKAETEWLLQMLRERSSEPAPADGWVRFLPLASFLDDPLQKWDEYDLQRFFTAQIANFSQQVGVSSLSFTELYAEWLDCRKLSPGQERLLPKRIGQWPSQPRIAMVVFCDAGDEKALDNTLASLDQQSYRAGVVLVLAPESFQLAPQRGARYVVRLGTGLEALNQWLASEQQFDWVFLARAGDHLHPHACVIMAERMALRAETLCLYIDEGTNDNLAPSAPIFKPDFNLDLMRSLPYVGRLLAFNASAVRELGGFDTSFAGLAPHDLLWRLVETHGLQVVEHIAEVLVQCRRGYAEWLGEASGHDQASRVVQAHLGRSGVNAQVEGIEGSLMTRVTYLHAQPASVSIVIHAGSDLTALMRCVESVLENTAYRHFEILLVANACTATDVRGWLIGLASLGSDQLRVVEVGALERIQSINEGCRQARADFLLLLDAGCFLFDAQWLSELMHQGQRPEVGLVGPKLFDSNGAVVSTGLVIGMQSGASSAFLGCPVGADGYMNRLRLVQNWSALSIDCLLVRRELFDELNGLDTANLQESLFDVDFCLRARALGYLAVWTPFSLVARLPVVAAQEVTAQGQQADRDMLYQRWLAWVALDPAYNRNLSLKVPNCNFDAGLRGGWDPFIARAMPSVLALPSTTSAIGHYRVVQPFAELERAGWIQGRIDYSAPGLIELEREKPDVMILQCRYLPANVRDIDRYKRFSSARRIYELDDYIIDPPKKNDHARNMPANMRELVAEAIGLCDRVVVSTEPLADALSSMHQDIRVVPNMLAAPLWTGLVSQRQTSTRPRVGWAGGTSHRGDLELLLDVVKTLSTEVDWVFFGMCPNELRPYVKEFYSGIPFALYPQKLASLNLDLALAPLEQNLFNDCKSNLRLLEYGACGFPVICTDTKAYAGYLPCTRVRENTTAQWLDAIRMHLSDPMASYRQGDGLREIVLRDYVLNEHHLQHWANAWLAD